MVQMSRGQSTAASAQNRNIGQQQPNQEAIQQLTELLGNVYKLAFKTQLCRWNIAGPTFYTLHARLGNQYRALCRSANRIGNRIRAINPEAQVNFGQFINLQQVSEQNNVPNSWQQIIQDLQNDHQQLAQQCQKIVANAQSSQDCATIYLLSKRANYHEKTVSKLHNVLVAQNAQASNS